MFTIDVRDMGLRARTMVAHLIFFRNEERPYTYSIFSKRQAH